MTAPTTATRARRGVLLATLSGHASDWGNGCKEVPEGEVTVTWHKAFVGTVLTFYQLWKEFEML